jgi:SAM-dependent methyltransferase
LRRRVIVNPISIRFYRRRLTKSSLLTESQRELLNEVNCRIHHNDFMYIGQRERYFVAGLSAVDCVNQVLERARPDPVRTVLDFPCGYGRELRFLVLRFPQATFTACEIQPGAANFCAAMFGAMAAYSRPELNDVSLGRTFDLIWCGSLATHLDEAATLDLLRLFSRHLAPAGILIITTHGDYVFDRLRRNESTYELTQEGVSELTAAYIRDGYGFQDYPRGLGYFDFHPAGRGYGVSLMSPKWMRKLAAQAGGLREVYFKERGWCDHQDVFAFAKEARVE